MPFLASRIWKMAVLQNSYPVLEVVGEAVHISEVNKITGVIMEDHHDEAEVGNT